MQIFHSLFRESIHKSAEACFRFIFEVVRQFFLTLWVDCLRNFLGQRLHHCRRIGNLLDFYFPLICFFIVSRYWVDRQLLWGVEWSSKRSEVRSLVWLDPRWFDTGRCRVRKRRYVFVINYWQVLSLLLLFILLQAKIKLLFVVAGRLLHSPWESAKLSLGVLFIKFIVFSTLLKDSFNRLLPILCEVVSF